MDVVHEHQDVLQNIEMAIMQVYKAHHQELSDDDVRDALNALIKTYSFEGKSIPLRLPPLSDLERQVIASIKAMCDWRLGRMTLETEQGDAVPSPAPESMEVIISALKRLVKSVDKWSSYAGNQGYLKFVSQYFPG